MIADPTGDVTRKFDVMREDQGLADRGTFIVDPDGIIQAMELQLRNRSKCQGVGSKSEGSSICQAHPDETCPAAWEEAPILFILRLIW